MCRAWTWGSHRRSRNKSGKPSTAPTQEPSREGECGSELQFTVCAPPRQHGQHRRTWRNARSPASSQTHQIANSGGRAQKSGFQHAHQGVLMQALTGIRGTPAILQISPTSQGLNNNSKKFILEHRRLQSRYCWSLDTFPPRGDSETQAHSSSGKRLIIRKTHITPSCPTGENESRGSLSGATLP